jgi:phage gp29-like protein
MTEPVPDFREFSPPENNIPVADSMYLRIQREEWKRGACATGIYAIFQQMVEKDVHLYSALQSRNIAVAACPYKIIPSDESAGAAKVALEVQRVVDSVPDLRRIFFQLLDGLAKGFAVAEIIWQVEKHTGKVSIADVLPRFPASFAFDHSGELYMTDTESGTATASQSSRLIPRPGESSLLMPRSRRLPSRKFITFVPQPSPAAPYGSALCAKAYWYYVFKNYAVAGWNRYNQRFAAPTPVARYRSEITDDTLDEIESKLDCLENGVNLVIPDGVELDMLEPAHPASAASYREFADWCNDEISKLVLGQTLTSSEGRRSGSLALGQVHERVRSDYLMADARALSAALTSQLVRWIVDFNFGTDVAAPALVLEADDADQLREELNLDQELIRMGVALAPHYFYQKYRRPAPAPGERSLKYDDANLYQYHLQFGVLTINEVRASLGLEPVSWGNVPPLVPGHVVHSQADKLNASGEQVDEQKRDRRKK